MCGQTIFWLLDNQRGGRRTFFYQGERLQDFFHEMVDAALVGGSRKIGRWIWLTMVKKKVVRPSPCRDFYCFLKFAENDSLEYISLAVGVAVNFLLPSLRHFVGRQARDIMPTHLVLQKTIKIHCSHPARITITIG